MRPLLQGSGAFTNISHETKVYLDVGYFLEHRFTFDMAGTWPDIDQSHVVFLQDLGVCRGDQIEADYPFNDQFDISPLDLAGLSDGWTAEEHESYGAAAQYALWVLTWLFDDGTIPPVTPWAHVPSYDTDRDDLVETPVDMTASGNDTGLITLLAEEDDPCVVIPLATTPKWVERLPLAGYLSQGAFTYLPYQYLSRGVDDSDGYNMAFSLHTCIMESGCLTLGSEHIKQVEVVRPRGNVVIFDFAWEGTQFREKGYPIGDAKDRSYVLHDVTPDDDADLQYDLYFASGVIHRFGEDGWLNVVSDETGASHVEAYWYIWDGYAGVNDNESFAAGKSRRYRSSLSWENGRLKSITYDAAAVNNFPIVVTPSFDAIGRISALSKTQHAESQSTLSLTRDRVTYGSGLSVSRSATLSRGSARSVSLTRVDAGGLPLVAELDMNAAERVTSCRVIVNGGVATTQFLYSDASGRYTSGLPKSSRITRIDYPDGSYVERVYDAVSGWRSSSIAPILNSTFTRRAEYSYTLNGVGDSGDPANPTNLVERPRKTDVFIGGALTERVLLSYSGCRRIVSQSCTNSSAVWNAPGNLITTNLYFAVRNPDETEPLDRGDVSAAGLLETSTYPGGYISNTWLLSGSTYPYFMRPPGFQQTRSSGESVLLDLTFDAADKKDVISEGEVQTYSAISTVDPFDRIVRIDYLDGTYQELTSYCSFGPKAVRERDGSTSSLEYDGFGRVRRMSHPAVGLETEYIFDGLGNVIRVNETAGGKARVMSYAYDAQGRLVGQTTPLGTTGIAYSSLATGTRKTTTYPDGSLLIEDFNFDGSLAEIQGSAAISHLRYNYGVDDGGFYTEEVRVGYSGTNKTYQNMLAAPCRTVSPAFGGGTATSQSLLDQYGRYSGSIDPVGSRSLTHYNSKNSVSDSGRHVNGAVDQLTPDSDDRYQTYTRTVNAGGILQNTQVYPDSGNASPSAACVIAGCAGRQVRFVKFCGPYEYMGAERGRHVGRGWWVLLQNQHGQRWTPDGFRL